MTSRQQSTVPRLSIEEKPARRPQYTIGDDVTAPLLFGGFTGFRAEIATARLQEWEHQHVIMGTTCCARKIMRMR
jgi:predicted lysophospholipase L1 biosynthesis ABC-type transport system permease subunit